MAGKRKREKVREGGDVERLREMSERDRDGDVNKRKKRNGGEEKEGHVAWPHLF